MHAHPKLCRLKTKTARPFSVGYPDGNPAGSRLPHAQYHYIPGGKRDLSNNIITRLNFLACLGDRLFSADNSDRIKAEWLVNLKRKGRINRLGQK